MSPRRLHSTLITLMIAAIAAVVIGGCGGDSDDRDAGSGSAAEGAAELDSKPEVEVPEGDPPSELETEDLVEGEGDPVVKGDFVRMQYVGVLFENGKQFDASWDSGQPFEFELGAGNVIEGWDKGIVGMRQGGRRMLVIPSELGYGSSGQPPDIPADATLVFVVDLVDIL